MGQKFCKRKTDGTRIKEVAVTHLQNKIINYRYELETQSPMTLVLGKTQILRRSREQPEESLQHCYERHLPITIAKYNDLISLCHGRIIPQEYHNFYDNLPKIATMLTQLMTPVHMKTDKEQQRGANYKKIFSFQDT